MQLFLYIDACYGKSQLKSRVGNGLKGSEASESNACSITFNFAPSIVYPFGNMSGKSIYLIYRNYSYAVIMDSLSTSYTQAYWYSYRDSYNYMKKSSDGKTLYWYCNDPYVSLNAESFANGDGATYYFLGIA